MRVIMKYKINTSNAFVFHDTLCIIKCNIRSFSGINTHYLSHFLKNLINVSKVPLFNMNPVNNLNNQKEVFYDKKVQTVSFHRISLIKERES